MGWMVPRSQLTSEQIRAIELNCDHHRMIVGGPGSGKTLALLHRARHLIDKFQLKTDRLRILVYTNALVEYLRSGLEDLGIPGTSVATFDSWCSSMLPKAPKAVAPSLNDSAEFERRRSSLLELASTKHFHPPLDLVLVDEGQDLTPTCYQILKRVSHHVTVCLDRKQQIYDRGASEATIREILGIRIPTISFLEIFRCCPYVSDLASAFIRDASERQDFQRQVRTDQGERETPVLYVERNTTELDQKLVDLVAARSQRGERVAILTPTRKQAFAIAGRLRQGGLLVEDPDHLRFATDDPKVLTIASAKGLTFDSVLVTHLSSKSFGSDARYRMDQLLFMAITRATRWVALMTTRDDLSLRRRLEYLETTGSLKIQSYADRDAEDGLFRKPQRSETRPADEFDDLL